MPDLWNPNSDPDEELPICHLCGNVIYHWQETAGCDEQLVHAVCPKEEEE